MHELAELATLTGLITEHDAEVSRLREKRASIALTLYKSGAVKHYKELCEAMDMSAIGVYKALIKSNGGPLSSE